MLILKRHSRVVKALQISNAVVGSRRHDPGITAFTQDVRKSVIVLKEKRRLGRERSTHTIPVDRIGKVNVEVRDHRFPGQSHVSRRGKVRLFHVLQLLHESLLRRTTRTRIPLDRALIDHDRKREARMSFRLRHDELRRLIDAVVRAIPVDDHPINSTADHVGDLAMNLFRVCRTVADIHMVRTTEPQQQMGINLGRRAGIQQAVNIDFTDVGGGAVPVTLSQETAGCTCVVGRLDGQSCGGYNRISCRAYTRPRQEHNESAPTSKTHLPSGAEFPRSCACMIWFRREGRHPCGFL